MTTKTAKDLVAEANREIEILSAEETAALLGDPTVALVDIREGEEIARTGKVAGAVNVPRGFLEFQVDPTSPTYKPEFGGTKRIVLYCASGNRSALGAKALQDMGFRHVAHVAGGFAALQQAGVPVEEAGQ